MRWLVSMLVLGFLAGSPVLAQEEGVVAKPPPDKLKLAPLTDFVRLMVNNHEEQTPIRLETSIRRYQRNDGVTLDLVNAIHLADRSYFEKLNGQFEIYDELLFEGVGGSEAMKQAQEGQADPLSGMYQMYSQMTGLAFQKDVVDYTAKNFVHADCKPDDLKAHAQKVMEETGNTPITLALDFAGALLRKMNTDSAKIREQLEKAQKSEQARENPFQGLSLFGGGNKLELKRQMAKELANADLTGPNGFGQFGQQIGYIVEQVIVVMRNEKAIEVLDQRLKKGEKRLGIFYGAAHGPHLEHLLKQRGFARDGEYWMTAWDMRGDDGGSKKLPAPFPLKK